MADTTSATRELVRMRTGRDPEELIRELYVERRLSDREISEAIGVDRVTVNKWRRDWNIRRDDRPAATELIA
jgi:transposase-like protein